MIEPHRDVPPPEAHTGPTLRWSVAAALVFVVALAVRLAVVVDLAGLPTQHALVEDAQAYDETAHELLRNGWLPEHAFYQAPLYPYFLAVCYSVLGPTPAGARLVQALLGAASALLLAACGRLLGGARVGLWTGLLAAFYVPFLFFVPLLLKPTLVILAESLFLLLAFLAMRTRSPWLFAAVGAALGLAMAVRGNLVLLLPAVVAWWVLEHLRHRRERTAARLAGEVAGLAAGFLVAVLPISWVNYQVSGDFVLTSSQSGSNFYIGNRKGATGVYVPLVPGRQTPAMEQDDARRVAAGLLSRERNAPVDPASTSPTEVSRAFWRQSRREIAESPGAWLQLLGRKTLLFWNAYEVPDAENQDVYAPESVWLRFNPVGFSWVGPLGLLGLALGLRRREGRDTSFLVWMVAASMVSVVLFYVLGRYRLPVVPFLLPAAALAVDDLVGSLRGRRLRRLALCLAALVLLGVLVWLPVVSSAERRAEVAVAHFNLGVAADRLLKENLDGDPEQAVLWAQTAAAHFDRARESDPSFVPTWVETAVLEQRMGYWLHRLGRLEEAKARYEEAERLLHRSAEMPRSAEFAEALDGVREDLLETLWRNRVLAAMDMARGYYRTGNHEAGRAALADAEEQVEKLRARRGEAEDDLSDRLQSLREELEGVPAGGR